LAPSRKQTLKSTPRPGNRRTVELTDPTQAKRRAGEHHLVGRLRVLNGKGPLNKSDFQFPAQLLDGQQTNAAEDRLARRRLDHAVFHDQQIGRGRLREVIALVEQQGRGAWKGRMDFAVGEPPMQPAALLDARIDANGGDLPYGGNGELSAFGKE